MNGQLFTARYRRVALGTHQRWQGYVTDSAGADIETDRTWKDLHDALNDANGILFEQERCSGSGIGYKYLNVGVELRKHP